MNANPKPILFAGYKINRHKLCNTNGWVIVYESVDSGPDYDIVRVKTSWHRLPSSEYLMKRDAARAHYQSKCRQGFVSPQTTF